LNWTDVAGNEASYVIERDVNGGGFSPLTTLPADSVTYTDDTVMSGETYIYRIAAVNNAGSSAWLDTSLNPILIP